MKVIQTALTRIDIPNVALLGGVGVPFVLPHLDDLKNGSTRIREVSIVTSFIGSNDFLPLDGTTGIIGITKTACFSPQLSEPVTSLSQMLSPAICHAQVVTSVTPYESSLLQMNQQVGATVHTRKDALVGIGVVGDAFTAWSHGISLSGSAALYITYDRLSLTDAELMTFFDATGCSS